MSETTRDYEPGTHPDLPPPPLTAGPIAWIRQSLFGSIGDTVLTLVCIYGLWLLIPAIYDWAYASAVVDAGSRRECQELGTGACWAFIGARLDQFTYGFYPVEEHWRVNLTFVLLFVAVAPVLFDKLPGRGKLLWFSLAYPVIAFFLIWGGLGLEPVESDRCRQIEKEKAPKNVKIGDC